jgi:hypothetical protein
MRHLLPLLIVLLLLPACGSREADLTPPEGWEGVGAERWWRTGIDTTGLFRDLDDFQAMGVQQVEGTMASAVQQRMLEMYRNRPHLVDSLFRADVLPGLQGVQPGADLNRQREELITDAYRTITRRFRPPSPTTALGRDVPLVYPDSLQQRGVAGQVAVQLYLDENGAPVAIEKREGIHPVQDALVMQSMTQMRWMPAYLDGRAIPSWARFQATLTPRQR